LADFVADSLPHKWSAVRCRSSVGPGKFAGHKLTFYHCATQPTSDKNPCSLLGGRFFSRRSGGI